MKITPPTWLTIVRMLISILLAALLYVDQPKYKYLIFVLFIVGAFTDYIDGVLARKHRSVSVLGKYLDPAADKVFTYSVLLPLVGLGKVSSIVVLIFIIRDVVVSAFRSYASSNNVIAAGMIGKMKTVLQMIALLLLIFTTSTYFMVGTVLLYISVVLSVVSGTLYIKEALQSRKA